MDQPKKNTYKKKYYINKKNKQLRNDFRIVYDFILNNQQDNFDTIFNKWQDTNQILIIKN